MFQRLNLIIDKPRRTAYLKLLLLFLLCSVLESLGVGAALPLLAALSDGDAFLRNEHVISFLNILSMPHTQNVLVQVAGVLIICAMLAKAAIGFISTRHQINLLFEERARITYRLFSHYLRIPYSQHIHKNMAAVMHLATGVSTTFTNVYMSAILTIVTEILVSLGLLAILILINVQAVLVVGVLAVSVGWIYLKVTRSLSRRLGEEEHRVVIATNKCLIEGLSALKEVRVYSASESFLSKLEELNTEYTAVSTNSTLFNQAPRLIIETLFSVAIVGSVMYLIYVGFDLKQAVPQLSVFALAVMRIMPSCNRILIGLASLRINEPALDMLYEELSEAGYLTLPPPNHSHPNNWISFERTIELANLHYTYPGAPAPSLSGITASIRKGQTIGLVGKSGAGKTTLVDILLGLLAPQQGLITIDGRTVQDLSELQGAVGYIPQSIYLMDDTLRHNVAFGVEDADIDDHAVRKAIQAAQLEGYVNSLPEGLDSKVGDRGVKLSGGQRQRVGIARALYRDPAILVLDEATSALDVETEGAVTDAIRELGKHKTLIVVAHRLSTVRDCEVLYLLDKGKIVAQGSYDELIRQNKWFSKISELNSTSHRDNAFHPP